MSFVNRKVTVPLETAVIIPPLVMVAIFTSELSQVPPVEGVIVASSPMHKLFTEGAFMEGGAFTITVTLFSEIHP